MNILFDHGIFISQKHGGISRYFAKIASDLNAIDGVNVDIFGGLFINRFLAEMRDTGNVEVHGSYVSVSDRFFRARKLLSPWMARSLASRYSILHHTYYYPILRNVAAARRVLTVYDMVHEKFSSTSARDYVSNMKRKAVESSDIVIAISQSTKNDLVEIFGVDPEKVKVVHLGAELNAQPRAGRLLDRPYILYVGQRSGYKNFETLVRAYASSAQLKQNFVLLAFGGEGMSQAEQGLIQSLQLRDRVIFRRGDDADLVTVYRDAAVFVYPSLYEGFGIPPLEAMQLGCPTIVSHTSSMPEVVGNASLLFDPRDADQLCSCLESSVFDNQLRNDLIERGYSRSKQFSWRKCAEETLGIYQTVLS